MKISIAMTTYNGELYIEKQIASILNQTRKPDEIIICDDCSTDGTVSVLQNLLEKEVDCDCRLIINGSNLGYRKNFKKSIELTSGDLIFLCDQDDIWEPEKLEKVEKIFINNKNVCALSSAFRLIDAQDQELPYKDRKGFCNHDQIRAKAGKGELLHIEYGMLLRYNISPGCTMAFRQDVKTEYLRYTESILPHDWEINLLAGIRNGCYFYNMPLIRYRIHGKNTLGMNTNDHLSVFQFEGDIDFRLASIKEKQEVIRMAERWHLHHKIAPEQLRQYKKIKKYDQLREKVVCRHQKLPWLHLLTMTIQLWDGKYIRFKSLFGDLFYAIKGGK